MNDVDPQATGTEATQAQAATDATSPSGSIECEPNKDPGVRLLIAACLFLGMGLYCVYDIASGQFPYASPSEDINAFGKWAFNFGGQFLMVPGLILVVWGILFFRRTCKADANGLHYAYFSKKPVAWEDIEKIDASKLKGKGILTLEVKDGRQVTLDSWKINNFKPLVVFIEQHVPAEKIKA